MALPVTLVSASGLPVTVVDGGGIPVFLGLTVGSTVISGGTTGRVLYDNAGVLGEMTNTGTGTVNVLQTSPTLITPDLGVAIATSIAIGGATLGSNAVAISGTLYVTGSSVGFTAISLESTEAAAALGPIADIYRNSATPANSDVLGGVQFAGNSSTGAKRVYGQIRSTIGSTANTAETGTMVFSVIKAGAITTALTINASGDVITSNGLYSSSYIGGNAASLINATVNGTINLSNFAVTGFTALTTQSGASTVIGWYQGTGSPEGAVTARIGSFYSRYDGGAVTSFYVKESGTGNTGWVAK